VRERIADRDELLQDLLGLTRLVALVVGPEDCTSLWVDGDGLDRRGTHVDAEDKAITG
jgi:hypothetical protein